MKNNLLIIISTLLVLCSSALAVDHAFDKGSKKIGGNLFFERQSGHAYKNASILIATPSVTYALTDGLFFGVNTQLVNTDYHNDSSVTNYSFGPIFEYYFPIYNPDKITESIIPYARLFYSKGKRGGLSSEYKGVNIGFLKMLNSHIGLDFTVAYSFDEIEVEKLWILHDQYNFSTYTTIEKVKGEQFIFGIGIESFIF